MRTTVGNIGVEMFRLCSFLIRSSFVLLQNKLSTHLPLSPSSSLSILSAFSLSVSAALSFYQPDFYCNFDYFSHDLSVSLTVFRSLYISLPVCISISSLPITNILSLSLSPYLFHFISLFVYLSTSFLHATSASFFPSLSLCIPTPLPPSIPFVFSLSLNSTQPKNLLSMNLEDIKN